MADEQWYWCLRHRRAEPAATACGSDLRMGPYDSAEDAEGYAERAEARNESWEEEDRRWRQE